MHEFLLEVDFFHNFIWMESGDRNIIFCCNSTLQKQPLMCNVINDIL